MHDLRSNGTAPLRSLWLAGLGACALWLVVQNTALLLALAWTDPGTLRAVVGALLKVGAMVTPKLWVVPVIVAVAGALVALILQGSNAAAVRQEVRHG